MRVYILSVVRAKVQLNFRSDVMQEYWKQCFLRFSWPPPPFQDATCLHLCTAAAFAQLPELAGVQTEVQAYLTSQNWVQCHTTDFFQFSSVAQSCPTCDPMDCSTPGFLVHHQLRELAQTHVH